ncbi:hypothetical protein BC834DRAFT_877702 [Gloeopeniophorella convolvens]|nr:hypothetical protein BC834DRAFT_877702 [Gloeopeniophorella convolvens]
MDGLNASLHAMPQLRTLRVLLDEQQFSPVKDRPQISLRELREFEFRGLSIHFEAIVGKVDAPCLSILSLQLSSPGFSVPSLTRLVCDSPYLKFNAMHLGIIRSKLYIESCPLVPSPGSGKLLLAINDRQVGNHSLPTQAVSEALQTVFVDVKTLALGFNDDRYPTAFTWNNFAEPGLWCPLISKFSNVTHLRVDDGNVPLVGALLRNHSVVQGLLPKLRDVLMLYRSEYGLGNNPTRGAEGWRSSILRSCPTVNVNVSFISGRNRWLSRHAQLGIS